jgi:hypothetical protein
MFMMITTITIFGRIILVLLIAGLVIFLLKLRKKGLFILAVILTVFLLPMFLRTWRTVPIKEPQASQTTHIPPVWTPGIEEQFKADVYATQESAARALARQITPLLQEVMRDQDISSDVQIYGQYYPDNQYHNVTMMSLKAFTKALQQHNEHEGITFTDVSGQQQSPEKISIILDVSRWWPGWQKGVLKARITGPYTNNVEHTVQYVKKPWVEGIYPNEYPRKKLILARSSDTCTSEEEAGQQAMDNACAQIRAMIHHQRGFKRLKEAGLTVSATDLHDYELIADRFTQSFQGTVGRIWRQALLLDVSSKKLKALYRQKSRELYGERLTLTRQVVSGLGLALTIFVLYIFLNAATRGYYTIALRLIMVVLVITGMVLIIMVV